MPVRTGILGAGFMGRVHAGILRRDRRVELSGVFDVDRQRGEEAARELSCALARTEEELFERSDAVYITVPNTLHAQTASRALQHGKHVFLEKPFATTLAEADSLRRQASRVQTVLQVGHNRRFAPAYRAVKECLKAGDIEPTLAHFKMNRGELESPAWVGNAAVTGGYLYETPLHLFDLARWFFGEVAEVRAHAARRVYSELDNFSFLLLFEPGMSLTFTSCAHATWAFPFERVEIFGRYLTIETAEMDRVSLFAGLNHPASVQDFSALGREDKLGYVAIDANFISAVLGEEIPGVTAEDGYRSVEIVDQCYRASRSRTNGHDGTQSEVV
jgi:myo-inositol 2-dehydrogenase/D-chiro-inositol 1-dehydrogenase